MRGSGQEESNALRTVRHVTPCLRSSSRIDMPLRWSRRIAAYSSTFGICGMTSTFHQEHPDAALARELVLPKLINTTRPWNGVPPNPSTSDVLLLDKLVVYGPASNVAPT